MNLDFGPEDGSGDGSPHEDAEERDLLVVLRLSNRMMGTNEERAEISMMADSIAAQVEEAGIGEYDGDEYGGGECILFFCGPNELDLVAFLRPRLQRSPYTRGAHFVRLVEGADGEMKRETIRL